MRKLTNKEKLSVYKYALENFETGYGLCKSIDSGLKSVLEINTTINEEHLDPYDHLDNVNGPYPEIAKHCPDPHKAYWFSINDVESRLEILRQAIKELTENEENI